MFKGNLIRQIILLLILSWCVLQNCGKSPNEPDSRKPAPPLTDSIPYDFLGQGKILFERTGPYPGNYSGTYLINLDERSTQVMDLGFIHTPMVSPQGDRLLFTWMQSNRPIWDVFVYNLQDHSSTQLTRGDSSAVNPVWSHDASDIYFRRHQFLLKIPAGGKPDQEIKLHTFFIKKDGQLLLNYPSAGMANSVNGLLAYTSAYNEVANLAGIYVMNEDGSQWRTVLTVSRSEYFDSPVFSPTGDMLYCLKIARGDSLEYISAEIGKVSVADGRYTTIVSLPVHGKKEWFWIAHEDDISPMNLCISPDGQKILFTLVTNDFESHIYCVNADGSALTQITSLEGTTDRNVSWGR